MSTKFILIIVSVVIAGILATILGLIVHFKNVKKTTRKRNFKKLLFGYEPVIAATVKHIPSWDIWPLPLEITDGVTVNQHDRLLVRKQENPKENGIYIWVNDRERWKRSTDMNKESDLIVGGSTYVIDGNRFGGSTMLLQALPDMDTDATTDKKKKKDRYHHHHQWDGYSVFFDTLNNTIFGDSIKPSSCLVTNKYGQVVWEDIDQVVAPTTTTEDDDHHQPLTSTVEISTKGLSFQPLKFPLNTDHDSKSMWNVILSGEDICYVSKILWQTNKSDQTFQVVLLEADWLTKPSTKHQEIDIEMIDEEGREISWEHLLKNAELSLRIITSSDTKKTLNLNINMVPENYFQV